MKLKPHHPTPFIYDKSLASSWRNHDINEHMIYSFRSNHFNRSNYPSGLHFHDYYEVVIITGGNIRYVCNGASYVPEFGDIVVIPPGKLHMSMIASDETIYSRHVFYFFPNAFDMYGCNALTHFLSELQNNIFFFTLSGKNREKLHDLLFKLDKSLENENPVDYALSLSYVFQIFHLFNQPIQSKRPHDSYLPASVIEIQNYLDEHYTEISSITEVATQFFYSREHVSRLFKKYLNTTVADYILKLRIGHSRKLMELNLSLTDICFQCGFSSVPAFIRAFKAEMGVTPSQYRRTHH